MIGYESHVIQDEQTTVFLGKQILQCTCVFYEVSIFSAYAEVSKHLEKCKIVFKLEGAWSQFPKHLFSRF